MADHDYAACQNELCVRCEAFGDGYRQGKGVDVGDTPGIVIPYHILSKLLAASVQSVQRRCQTPLRAR